jgi:hypothetical protein
MLKWTRRRVRGNRGFSSTNTLYVCPYVVSNGDIGTTPLHWCKEFVHASWQMHEEYNSYYYTLQ